MKKNYLGKSWNGFFAVLCGLAAVSFGAADGMLISRSRYDTVHHNLGGEYVAAVLLALLVVLFLVAAAYLLWQAYPEQLSRLLFWQDRRPKAAPRGKVRRGPWDPA